MAEAFIERGCTATVVERPPSRCGCSTRISAPASADAMRDHGIDVLTDTDVSGFEPGRVLTSAGPLDADLVVLGIGVAPRTELAEAAGIELGPTGAIRVDDRQATSADAVWAAGDCAESDHLVTGPPVHIALGTYANKHGRVAGINMAGGDARSRAGRSAPRSPSCARSRSALTGLRQRAAADAGLDAVSVTVESTTSPGYLPARPPDDRAHGGRAGHRPAARRPDRRRSRARRSASTPSPRRSRPA